MGEERKAKYHFSTRDLLYVALVSALGGVTSTYVGYVGSTLGSLTGIPMGGQLISGLHIFWIILVLAVVDKKGAGVLTGLVKGFVEFATGSHLGVLVLVTSLLEGLFAEAGYWPLRKYRTAAFLLAGGLGSWANLLVTQTLFNAFPGLAMFGTLSVIAFASGVVFAGLMGSGIIRSLADAGIIRLQAADNRQKRLTLPGITAVVLFTGILVLFAAHFLMPGQALVDSTGKYMDPIAGATSYFTINGSVSRPGTIDLRDYRQEFITINAVNRRGGNHAYDFTGVPLNRLLTEAGTAGNATRLEIVAADNYAMTFDLATVMADRTYILVPENDEVDLVAKNTTSHDWVRGIVTINVY